MTRKPTLKKPQPLTAAIIAYMQAGEERGDAQCAGLRVRCLASGQKVFFYRYRARDGALREIRLGEVGPLTLTKARHAVARKRLEREQGKDPQLEKRKEREQATRERLAQRQATDALENLVNEYIDEVLKGQKRGAESAPILRQDLLPVLGHRPALQITRRELQDEVIRPKMAKAPKSSPGAISGPCSTEYPIGFSHASAASSTTDSVKAAITAPATTARRARRAPAIRACCRCAARAPRAPFSRIRRESCAGARRRPAAAARRP